MFLPKSIAQQIALIFYNEDIICRNELYSNQLVSERDYVTAFTTGLRRQFSISNSIYIHSQTLPGSLEQNLGADAILIVIYNGKAKVAFFESKWPRIINDPYYNWDYVSNNFSHFTNQLKRQEKYIERFAFWETFFYEGQAGFDSPPFDTLGSSILLQPDALTFAYDQFLEVSQWRNSHLRSILRYKGRNLYNVMLLFLTCRIGKMHFFQDSPNSKNLPYVIDLQNRIEIPIANINIESEMNESLNNQVENFMIKNGLSTYILLDASDFEKYTINKI